MTNLKKHGAQQFERHGTQPAAGLDSAPHRLGDYLIHRQIGEGGMGKVYAAEEYLTRRRVALKILHGELAQSERGRRQFVTEMSVLANLDNPHVVRCLHATEIDGELVMVLEYLEGHTLRAHLERVGGRLDWVATVGIAWQIATALEAAHGCSAPIIHRDLKPENVMVLDSGHVKVMDFGIAKVLQTVSNNTTHSAGTLQYMSPEQIDARPVDPRSDLFALGLMMWEMLAGHPPFSSESPRLLLEQLCSKPTPRLPDHALIGLPSGVEELVFQLLEKDPARRPANATDVLQRLGSFRPMLGTVGPTSRGLATPPARPGSPELALSTGTPVPINTLDVVLRAAGPVVLPLGQALAIIFGLSFGAGFVTWVICLLVM